MKFSVPSSEFQRTLTRVAGVVPSKSTLPILENILVELKKNTLRLVATDLEISMSATMEVKGSEDGTITVPAKRLMDTVRSLPEIEVIFTGDLSANKVKMITETGEYQLLGEPSTDFPAVPEMKGDGEIRIDGAMLKRVIHKTSFAVSTDELRPAMTGVLLQIREKDINAVATDGHRLVCYRVKKEKVAKDSRDVIIPAKALNILVRTLEDGEYTVAMSNTHIQFRVAHTTLTSRLIEEKYPNYESVIPGENNRILNVKREDLLGVVRRVALYSSATTHQIRFSAKKNELRLAAEDIDFGGEAREKISCSYNDEEMEIGFNSNYVVDLLSHIDSDDVAFKLSTPVRAAIITPGTQKEGEDLLMLVMPVRLNN